MIVGLFQKNPNRRNWGHTFLKKNLDLLDLSLYPWKFWTKKAFFTTGNFVKLCYTPWKFQDQKIRLMKIQKSFTDGSSVKLFNTLWSPTEIALLFQLNSRISAWYFLQYPRKFHVLNPPHLDLIYIYIYIYITELKSFL